MKRVHEDANAFVRFVERIVDKFDGASAETLVLSFRYHLSKMRELIGAVHEHAATIMATPLPTLVSKKNTQSVPPPQPMLRLVQQHPGPLSSSRRHYTSCPSRAASSPSASLPCKPTAVRGGGWTSLIPSPVRPLCF